MNRMVDCPVFSSRLAAAGQHPAHVGHVGFHAAEPLELAPRLAGDDLRQRSLAGARRPVENQGLDAVGLDGAAQQLAGSQDMRLAGEFGQVARPHAGGQRLRGEGLRFVLRRHHRRLLPAGKQIMACHSLNITANDRSTKLEPGQRDRGKTGF